MSSAKNSMQKKDTSSLATMKKDDIVNMLSTQFDSIRSLKPKWSLLEPDYIVTATALQVLRDDKLQKCSKASLIGAMLKMATTGLTYDQDECYLIPYAGQIQFMPSYKGVKRLAERSVKIQRITTRAVYSGDEFEYWYGLRPDIKHTPDANGSRKWQDLTHAYSIAYFVDGSFEFLVLNKEEIERRRMTSKFQSATPSKHWLLGYDKMAKSKAIRDLVDELPIEPEIKQTIKDSDEDEYYKQPAETAEYVDEDTGEVTDEDPTIAKAKELLGEDAEEIDYEEMPND